MTKRQHALAPYERADESVRGILRRLLHALRSNVEGVLEDTDIDALHDLRVANRRTRTALSQISCVLPKSDVDAFAPEFKWLGDVTGPCRDLDVFLLDLNIYQQRSGIENDAIEPLKDFLSEKRQREHSLVRVALQSERFQRLVDGWGRFLESGAEAETNPTLASSPIIEVADPRILKACRRMRNRGAGVAVDPPAALLHRLRIDGKKLRYLLEFFSDLYPRTTISRFIKELKQLQDILGGFNDTQIQLALIKEFTNYGAPISKTLAATTHLVDTIAVRELGLRSEFAERFDFFAGDESRKLYKRTFKIR